MAEAIRELLIKVTVEADEKPLEEVGKASDETGTKAVALGTVIGNLVTKLGEMAIAAAKAGAAMLKDLVFGTAEAADEIAKTSQQLAINAEGLQRLRGAAQLSGAATSDLDKGIRTLQKGLADAADKGTGPASDALATLGLEVAEIDSLLQEGDIEGALGTIGDAFAETGDSALKNSALLDLFGAKAGSQLRPLIEQGTEGIKGLGDEISATGSVIESEALSQFEEFQDANFLLSQRVQGVKQQIAIALAPAVVDIADKIGAWVDENRGFIEQDLPMIMEDLGNTLIDVATFTIDLLKSWREFIRDTTDLAEIIAEDLGPGLDGVSDTLAGMTSIADGLALALADITVQFLEAVGAGEELIQIFKEIRSAVGGDQEVRASRGAPGFLGGGTALVNQADVKNADSSGDTAKLRKIAADPRFSEADRTRVAAEADRIDAREAAKAEQAAARKREERQAAIEASRQRTRGARRERRSRGGGGGRARPARTEPTVEDLIGTAVGGAGPQALRSAADALSGTLLVNQDNRIVFTVEAGAVDVGGVQVSASLPADVGPEAAEVIQGVVRDEISEQARRARDVIAARRNVGP